MKKLTFVLLALVSIAIFPTRSFAFRDLAQQALVDKAMKKERKAQPEIATQAPTDKVASSSASPVEVRAGHP